MWNPTCNVAFLLALGVFQTGSAVQAAPILVRLNQSLVIDQYPANDFKSVTLDLNNDGTPDVQITHQSFRLTHVNFADSVDTAIGLNGAMLLTSAGFAASLSPGQTVGPAGAFTASNTTLIDTEYYRDLNGNSPGNLAFLNPDVAIGVQIPVSGNNYYAWLGVQSRGSTNTIGTNTLLLHDYGYDTTPSVATAAQAPEPAAGTWLGLIGSMLMLRRRRPPTGSAIQTLQDSRAAAFC